MAVNHDQNVTITLDDTGDSIVIIERDEQDESIFQEDWDNFEGPTDSDGQTVINDFFLLMEINRFVPYVIDTNIKFHPLNMPHIKIGKITVVGFVIDVNESLSHIEILVEDGTGVLVIRYELKQYAKDQEIRQEILNKYQEFATNINKTNFDDSKMCPKLLPEIRPDLCYPEGTPIERIAILESKWSLDTKKGLLGKAIVSTDYVIATGYCHLDFQFQCSSRSSDDIEFDHLCKAEPLLMATSVECIEEADYNKQIKKWMHINAKRRYKISGAMS